MKKWIKALWSQRNLQIMENKERGEEKGISMRPNFWIRGPKARWRQSKNVT